jgi:hypothetical protein
MNTNSETRSDRSRILRTPASPLLAVVGLAVLAGGVHFWHFSGDSSAGDQARGFPSTTTVKSPPPSVQDLVDRALADHSAAFPLSPSLSTPVEVTVEQQLAEHEALIESWLSGV